MNRLIETAELFYEKNRVDIMDGVKEYAGEGVPEELEEIIKKGIVIGFTYGFLECYRKVKEFMKK